MLTGYRCVVLNAHFGATFGVGQDGRALEEY